MAFATINKGADYFVPVLYTGTGSSTSITTGFGPDLVWIKGNVAGTAHYWFDSVRGTGRNISSNSTDAEVNWTGGPEGSVSAFNSTSFSLSADTNGNANYSGRSYFSWSWRASDSSAVTNTAGSITSTVSANTTAGFSIVSYTGNGSNSTVGHGLGVAPKFIIFKNRSSATGWACYNVNIGASKYLALNETIEAQTATGISNSTDPTSSVFSIGTADRVNTNGNTYIAYCFADVKGYSKMGSYTGNGSTDGTFVYTGFKPAFVMIKQTSAAGEGWEMADDVRSTYNVITTFLRANSTAAESTNTDRQFDFLSNGIKMRGSHGSTNGSGATYIYMAFAENPFVLTDGTPVTAR